MAAISRRSVAFPIPASTVLAAADDLNGAGTQVDVTGASRLLIVQNPIGTAGTAGIDVIEVSHDGGDTWVADPTLLALASDDTTGTIVTALNAAGVEPTGAAIFKSGPHRGPTKIRCGRGGSGEAGTAWVTGAPQVFLITVG